jgi:hypothetical protein
MPSGPRIIGCPPAAQLTPTRISDRPMTSMTVPVTIRREEPHPSAEERRGEEREDARADHGADDARHAKLRVGARRDDRGNRGEGDAHHDRQPDADIADADRLDEGHETTTEQVRADEHGDLFLWQMQGTADDERHGNRAGIHD